MVFYLNGGASLATTNIPQSQNIWHIGRPPAVRKIPAAYKGSLPPLLRGCRMAFFVRPNRSSQARSGNTIFRCVWPTRPSIPSRHGYCEPRRRAPDDVIRRFGFSVGLGVSIVFKYTLKDICAPAVCAIGHTRACRLWRKTHTGMESPSATAKMFDQLPGGGYRRFNQGRRHEPVGRPPSVCKPESGGEV